MAALVESLMLYREPAWHGQGTIVKEALTSQDALHTAELDWKVNQEPIKMMDGKIIPGYFANVRDKDNSVLGITSDRYKIVQNEECFKFLDDLIGCDLTYESAGSLRGGKVTFMLAHFPQTEILGDKVDNYICFTNTFDKSGAVKCFCTPVRVVCQNTLNAAISGAKNSWSFKHMGQLDAKLDQARQTLELNQVYMEQLNKRAEEFAKKNISDVFVQKMMNDLFPINTEDSDVIQLRARNNRDSFRACLKADDIANFKGTAWGIYNAAADFNDHRIPDRKTTTYRENNFLKILNGQSVSQKVYDMLSEAV